MERADHLRLIESLRAEQGGVAIDRGAAFAIPAARYRDPVHFTREQQALATVPRVLAASAAVGRGGCLPVDTADAAILLVRDGDGELRGFVNACRHRATRLIDEACSAKAVVCPYHGWTYDLRGTLLHVPHAESFGSACEGRDLHPLEVVERHGLIWRGSRDVVAAHLGPLDTELAALALDRSVAWRTTRATRRCNWKLVIEAFLDGYHIRTLHRDSIYRFFLDAASLAEPVGPHIRAVTARRPLREAPVPLPTGADLHALGTPSYVIFPTTVVIEHPDFVSVIVLAPRAVDTTDWHHVMLVPADRADDAEHWDRSWALIEETVFQREDLWICEQAQRGLADPITDELLFGALECPVRWFHAAIEQTVG